MDVPREVISIIFDYILDIDYSKICNFTLLNTSYYKIYHEIRREIIRGHFMYSRTCIISVFTRGLTEAKRASISHIIHSLNVMRQLVKIRQHTDKIFTHGYSAISFVFVNLGIPMFSCVKIRLGRSYLRLIYNHYRFIARKGARDIHRIIEFLECFMPEVYDILKMVKYSY